MPPPMTPPPITPTFLMSSIFMDPPSLVMLAGLDRCGSRCPVSRR
jgi:hypothetical protein